MAIIKNSQFPIAATISQSAYVPIIDLNQPVGSQNQIILASALASTGGVSNVTLDGLPVSTLDPTYFSFNGNGVTLQNLPSGGSVTVNGDPVSALDPTYFIIDGTTTLQNLPTQVTVGGDPVSNLDTSYFVIGQNGLTLQNIPTGAVVTVNGTQVNALNPNQFAFIDGNGTAAISFSNLNDVGELNTDTVVLIANNDSVYSTTMGAIAAYVGVVSATPTITLPSVSDQIFNGADLNVTGTLTNYGNAPNLLVWIDGAFVGSIGYLPFFGSSLGTINSNTSFTVDLPSSDFGSLGSHTIFITDWIGTISNTQNYNVVRPAATGATVSVPMGTYFTNSPVEVDVTITPSDATVYAALYNEFGEIDPRTEIDGSGSTTLTTTSVPGTYFALAYDAPTGGNQLGNTQFTVNQFATAATITGAANSPVQNQPLTGFGVTLTPSDAFSYAVLAYNNGGGPIEDGARQIFTGSLPTLTPSQASDNYELWIVTTPDTNTGVFLAQSSPFAVTS